ncbi:MAG: substrate-binding domain-containing protein [Rhodospirillales bacterium]|nr:substrate-binding domain-containing protein [Rhodospirillales bacterium]
MKKTLCTMLAAAGLMLGAAPASAEVLGVALASDTNPFYIAMRGGIEARAKELGWEVRIVTANENVNTQVNGVLDLVAQKVDGILISPIDAVATAAAYEAASKAGIPIISVARGAKSPHQTLFVAMDEKQIGRDIAEWIAKAAGGKGKVAMIAGPAGAATFQNLEAGFAEQIAKHKDMPVVYKKNVALTREDGLREAEDILVAHPDVRAIYSANDELALGAVQAAVAAGKKGGIVITGMNGVPPAVMSVMKGELDMTVQLSPVGWGRLGVDTMAGWLKGERPSQQVFIKHVMIDKSNAEKALPPKKK